MYELLYILSTMTDTISISDARENLPSIIDSISKTLTRCLLTVHGQPKAVLLSVEELESLEETAEILSIPGAKQSIKKGLKEAKRGIGTPLAEL